MTERARTKDEKFMIRLYEEALKQPSMDDPLDRYLIGNSLGLHAKAVDTICVLLGQANFIKKQSKTEISITPHGIKLVDNLRETK